MTNSPKKASNQGKQTKSTATRKKPAESNRFSPLPNRRAVEILIEELTARDRLTWQDLGLINACRSAADLVDDQPTPAALKEYGNLLDKLRAIGKENDNDFYALLDELRTPLRDSQP